MGARGKRVAREHKANDLPCATTSLQPDGAVRRLTADNLRFLVRYALSRLPKGLLRDIQLDRAKRDVALDLAAERVCAQLDRHEVYAPDPSEPH